MISGTIRNVVHLIQQKRNAEVIASPRVMMVSGQTASIESVEEIAYNEKHRRPAAAKTLLLQRHLRTLVSN